MTTTELLIDYGFTPNLRGYYYLKKAIDFISTTPDDDIIATTKILYPALGLTFDTSEASIERAIRYSIAMNDSEKIKRIKKPTNTTIIMLLAEIKRDS
ncbi:MAG: sporulation initiation factor Spo0A C-terminal domain-containing protein [bacterium]|nr:sporulation initiation factor Spo0A C-terminal domain-containing protein [bacterium]